MDLVLELAVREDVRKVVANAAHHGTPDLDGIHGSVHRVEQRVRVAFAGHRLRIGVLTLRCVEDSGAGEPRTQHGHADAFGSQAEPKRLAEAAYGELRCGVRTTFVRQRGDAGDRRGVDDVPTATVLAYERHERLDHVHCAAKVHGHCSIPVREARIGDCTAAGNSGVVAQDVNRAERGNDRLRRFGN